MLKIFLDSSVLFSAIYSNRGHARDLIILAEQKKVTLVISKYVLEEVRKNLKNKANGLGNLLDQLVKTVPIKVCVNPSERLIKQVKLYVHPKDAPVVAAAIHSKADFVVSFDRKDLVENDIAKKNSPVKIVFPNEVVQKFIF